MEKIEFITGEQLFYLLREGVLSYFDEEAEEIEVELDSLTTYKCKEDNFTCEVIFLENSILAIKTINNKKPNKKQSFFEHNNILYFYSNNCLGDFEEGNLIINYLKKRYKRNLPKIFFL